MNRNMAKSSDPGALFAARGGLGVNVFRDAWEYRITDDGARRLAARSGASPAFLGILAIASAAPVTFALVASQVPHIDGNDLELWLSTLCEMGLLSPVEAGTAPLVAAMPSVAVAMPADVPAPVAVAAPAAIATPVPVTQVLPVALLVHAEARVRANWRRALAGRGFEFQESAELETVERLLRERRPAWIVLGLDGGDFDGLHLLRALKRPRAPRISRVCLVVPRGRTLAADAAETAARADATANSVTDIVRALCGDAAVDESAESHTAVSAAQSASADAQVSDAAVAEPVPAVLASKAGGKPAQAPANAPAWMNFLYRDAYQYGSFEAEHPSDLELQYPRLMVRMIEGWSRPELAAEINQLMVDERGGRQGFPPEVMEELWFLYQMHQAMHAQSESRPAAVATHAYPATALLQPDAAFAVRALH